MSISSPRREWRVSLDGKIPFDHGVDGSFEEPIDDEGTHIRVALGHGCVRTQRAASIAASPTSRR
jgi:hypothetical protein